MSAHLGWEPAEPRPLGGSLGPSMRDVLADRYCNGDGIGIYEDGIELDEDDVAFLEGVKAASAGDLADDAECLLAGIRQHKRIRLVRC